MGMMRIRHSVGGYLVASLFAAACGSDGGSGGGGGAGGKFDGGVCNSGDTRPCTGPGACQGGQSCDASGTWSACDCASGTGGSSGSDSGTDLCTGVTCTNQACVNGSCVGVCSPGGKAVQRNTTATVRRERRLAGCDALLGREPVLLPGNVFGDACQLPDEWTRTR